MMRKKGFLPVLLLILVLFVGGCGGINNKTPVDAAKVLMQACIQGDSKLMNEINHSNPLMYPPDLMLQEASKHKLYNYKLSDFTFTADGADTVIINSKKANLNWKCLFVKEKEGWFFEEID